MTGFRLKRYLVVSVGLLAATGMISGCSKKQAQSSGTQPVASDVAATSAPAPETPTADAAAQPPTGPVLDASQMEGNAKQAMAEADAALRQKEYEKAVRTMLAIQQAQLNAQQAAAAHQQMLALQKNLALGVASGDPNAIAAAQLLRAGRSH